MPKSSHHTQLSKDARKAAILQQVLYSDPFRTGYSNIPTIETVWSPLITRQYVREHNLDVEDGRSHRSFWAGIDSFYAEKKKELGESFDSPGWARYLEAMFDLDEQMAPPPAPRYIQPLFTYTPLVLKLFSSPRCWPEEHIHSGGGDATKKNRLEWGNARRQRKASAARILLLPGSSSSA
ncbi:hypothetical protein C8R47DRAFT_1066058 [Mycena vitilis]|nr:hypothetical protein C8R47DRAFT_1066058 [Mycena vitilis]